MRWSRILISVLILTISTLQVFGQKAVTNQQLIWYGYFLTLQFNEKWYVQTELQERHFVNPTAQNQFLTRTHLHRILGNTGWETSAGFALFLHDSNDPYSTVKLTVPELRPHLEFAYKQKLKRVTYDQRLRAEARFFHDTNKERTDLEDGYTFENYRFRYRFQATIPVWKMDDKRFLKIKLSDEIHLNVGKNVVKNVFDQNRFYAGLSVDILKNLAFDVGYLNLFQQRSNGDYYNRDILRFTVFHKIDFSK